MFLDLDKELDLLSSWRWDTHQRYDYQENSQVLWSFIKLYLWSSDLKCMYGTQYLTAQRTKFSIFVSNLILFSIIKSTKHGWRVYLEVLIHEGSEIELHSWLFIFVFNKLLLIARLVWTIIHCRVCDNWPLYDVLKLFRKGHGHMAVVEVWDRHKNNI